MEYTEFCAKFCEIEARYKLFDLEFNEIKYWKYARYYVFNILGQKLYDLSVPFWLDTENPWKLPRYSHQYQKYTDAIFHNVNLTSEKDIMLFTFQRRVKYKKKFISPVTDEISLHLQRSHCIIEEPYCEGYYRPTPIRNIKYYDVWEGIGDETKVYTPINRGQLRKQLLHTFEQEYDITFTQSEKKNIISNLNYYIMYHDELVAKYMKILSRIRPKVVIYTSSYIGIRVVLTEVLKELNIPCIEILHGYVDDNCIAYNYSETGMNDSLPDYIFAYSQVQKDTLNWGIPRDHIRGVGNPWLEKRSKKFLAERGEKRNKKRITFISSANPAIEKYLVHLADHIDQDDYEIIFKLHPEEYALWKKVYQDLPDHVKVIDNNDKDIHYYLANSDFVAGITSTALFEAAVYPVQIYILAEESWQSMHILLNAGRASLIQDCRELYSSIMNDQNKNNKIDCNFYAENAIDNINTEIEKIIREGEKEC